MCLSRSCSIFTGCHVRAFGEKGARLKPWGRCPKTFTFTSSTQYLPACYPKALEGCAVNILQCFHVSHGVCIQLMPLFSLELQISYQELAVLGKGFGGICHSALLLGPARPEGWLLGCRHLCALIRDTPWYQVTGSLVAWTRRQRLMAGAEAAGATLKAVGSRAWPPVYPCTSLAVVLGVAKTKACHLHML